MDKKVGQVNNLRRIGNPPPAVRSNSPSAQERRSRLKRELAKLDPKEEERLAEEGLCDSD